MDAVKSIYSYFTGVPKSEHRLVDIGIPMTKTMERRYVVKDTSGNYSTRPVQKLVDGRWNIFDYKVSSTDAFKKDLNRSLRSFSMEVDVGPTEPHILYRFPVASNETGYVSDRELAIGSIYISYVTSIKSRGEGQYFPNREENPGFLILRFVPKKFTEHDSKLASKLTEDDFKQIKEGIRKTLSRLSGQEEEDIPKIQERVKIFMDETEAGKGLPANIGANLASFFMGPNTRKNTNLPKLTGHLGATKRKGGPGNIREILNERLRNRTKRAAHGGSRNRRTRR